MVMEEGQRSDSADLATVHAANAKKAKAMCGCSELARATAASCGASSVVAASATMIDFRVRERLQRHVTSSPLSDLHGSATSSSPMD